MDRVPKFRDRFVNAQSSRHKMRFSGGGKGGGGGDREREEGRGSPLMDLTLSSTESGSTKKFLGELIRSQREEPYTNPTRSDTFLVVGL